MRDGIAEFAAATFRPILTEAVLGFERVAVLTALLVGCTLLAVAAVVALIAAGAAALVPAVGPTAAIAIGAAALLLASLAVGIPARRMLKSRVDGSGSGAGPGQAPKSIPAMQAPAPASGGPGAAPAPARAAMDPTLIAAAVAAGVIIIGPWRVLRSLRRTVDVVRFASSLMAGVELFRTLGPLMTGMNAVGRASATPSGAGPRTGEETPR